MIRALALLVALFWAMLEAAGVPNEWEIPDAIPATTVYRPAPSVTSTTYTPVPSTSVTVTSSSTTTTEPAQPALETETLRCGRWAGLASDAGWPDEWLPLLLDDIMWDESRCLADVVSGTGDWGLLQINWSTWGTYVESFGWTRDDLLLPSLNLWIGLQIAHKADEAGWGWCQPWDMSGRRTCEP